jgi:hypothetical protein
MNLIKNSKESLPQKLMVDKKKIFKTEKEKQLKGNYCDSIFRE